MKRHKHRPWQTVEQFPLFIKRKGQTKGATTRLQTTKHHGYLEHRSGKEEEPYTTTDRWKEINTQWQTVYNSSPYSSKENGRQGEGQRDYKQNKASSIISI